MIAAAGTAALLFALAGSAAGDVSVRAYVDQTATSVDHPIMLTIEVQGTMQNVPAPTLPDLSDEWSVRSSGTSSNMSWVNGQVSVSKSWNYNLLPRRAGTLTIGAAEVEFDGKIYRTDPIQVEVTAGQPRAQQMEEHPSSGVQSGGRDVFITTSVDRKSAYVDQQITLSFKFYRRISLWGQPRYAAPDLTGFWAEDLGEQDEYYETVDGLRYRVIEIKTALFGAAPGTAAIGAATLTYSAEQPGFTFFSTGGRPVTLTTDPIDVEVLALPAEGRPADFAGAVGSYSVKASIDPEAVAAFEPATLTLTISGTGNLRTVPEPVLPDLPEFKLYESRTSTETTKKNGAVGGVKHYEYVLVPQSPGEKEIPPIGLSFFNPAERRYAAVATAPLRLSVSPAAATAGVEEPPVRAAISRLGRDVRYIHEPSGMLRRWGRPLYERTPFLLLQVIPILLLAGAVADRRRRDRLEGDEGLRRRLGAPRAARKELREARARLAAGDAAGACSAVARGVTDFVGGAWNVQARAMTVGELESVLRGAGASEELVGRVSALLAACDLGRFAGGGPAVEAQRLLDEAERSLKDLARLAGRRRR